MSKFHASSVQVGISHKGPAHRDDFVSMCLAFVTCPQLDRIERRDPTPEELEDPAVLVVDVGGRLEPEFSNFDHHQFSRDADPVCALTLFLEALGVLEEAREAWGWLDFTELLDSKGPLQVGRECADRLGIANDKKEVWEELSKAMSPVEGWLLREFSHRSFVLRESPFGELMTNFGGSLLKGLEEGAARMLLLEETAEIRNVGGLLWVDATSIPGNEQPTFCLERWTKKNAPRAAGTITMDDRGPGVSLFRREDHPRVDFSRIVGKPGVGFTHKNGFVAKLLPEADLIKLLLASIKP